MAIHGKGIEHGPPYLSILVCICVCHCFARSCLGHTPMSHARLEAKQGSKPKLLKAVKHYGAFQSRRRVIHVQTNQALTLPANNTPRHLRLLPQERWS